jgi:RNA polymerase sigma-70 factor (ECF subfamily)
MDSEVAMTENALRGQGIAGAELPATARREEAVATPVERTFREVFEAEFSYVWRTLRRFGVSEADLDDVTQEVFVAVHKKFDGYDRARPIRPWLVSFAHRCASNYARQRERRSKLDARAEEREVCSPEERASERQAQELVLDALQSVRLERRAVFTMHDIDGFTAGEIADALEIPLNTVYSRLRLARAEFWKAVEERKERA